MPGKFEFVLHDDNKKIDVKDATQRVSIKFSPGDKVIVFNQHSGRYEWHSVDQVHVVISKEIIKSTYTLFDPVSHELDEQEFEEDELFEKQEDIVIIDMTKDETDVDINSYNLPVEPPKTTTHDSIDELPF
jgi:hypothetical protein